MNINIIERLKNSDSKLFGFEHLTKIIQYITKPDIAQAPIAALYTTGYYSVNMSIYDGENNHLSSPINVDIPVVPESIEQHDAEVFDIEGDLSEESVTDQIAEQPLVFEQTVIDEKIEVGTPEDDVLQEVAESVTTEQLEKPIYESEAQSIQITESQVLPKSKKSKKKKDKKRAARHTFDENEEPISAFTSWLSKLQPLTESPLAKTKKRKKNRKHKEVKALAKQSITLPEGIASDYYANLLENQGHYEKAIEMYNKLSDSNPMRSEYYANLIARCNDKIQG